MASDSNGSSMPSWQLFMLFAAAMGAFLNTGKLGSLSPAAIEPASDKGTLIVAHLSDDPFDAWVRADGRLDVGGESSLVGVKGTGLPGPIESPEAFGASVKASRICILPVIVRGDFHSTEAREMRIRFRAATVSGLGAQGLVADDPEHLLLISPPIDWAAGPGRKPPGIDDPLPAEWFVADNLARDPRKPQPYAAVLVVWVQGETLVTNPLRALDGLRSQLMPQVQNLTGLGADRIDFKVIGPYWSGTLKDILVENRAFPDRGSAITFYSSSATMANGVLDLLVQGGNPGPDAGNPVPAGRKLLDGRPGNGPRLVNLTCTDEELAESFLDELKLRGVDVGGESTRIAIVSDWDTDYGRAMPLTFAAKLNQLNQPHGKNPLPSLPAESYFDLKFDSDKGWPPQVLRAYYISGVGGTAASAGAGGKADGTGKSDDDSDDSHLFERAQGEHQVDYIARLGMVFADRLSTRDPHAPSGVASKSKPTTLSAIGLLGSNVYDQMLLLQALRPRFPDAIFFSDKLDARFIDPASIKYTRNVVVASSYGLELFQKLQRGVPPFRGAEQTGAFLAVQMAVGPPMPEVLYFRSHTLPLRFEIGRTYPVRLYLPPDKSTYPEDSNAPSSANLLHPKNEMPLLPGGTFWRQHIADTLLLGVGAVVFGAMVLFIFLGRFSLEPDERADRSVALSLIAALAVIFVLFNAFYDGLEPLTLIEGVSIWPSELVRLVATMTAFAGVHYCVSRVKKSRILLCRDFGLIEAPPVLRHRHGILAAAREVLMRMPLKQGDYLLTEEENKAAVLALEKPGSNYRHAVAAAKAIRQTESASKEGPARYVSSQILWRYLCERSTPMRRRVRAAMLTLAYMTGWACLFVTIGIPMSPTRGAFSVAFDDSLLLAASLLMCYLLFWVVDETQSCFRFVSRLGEDHPSLWPRRAFDRIPSINRTEGLKLDARRKASSAYVEVRFIGRLTAEAVPLIILPFVVLTLLIFARWAFFANWHVSPSVLLFYGVNAGICALCAVLLKNAATKAKRRAVRSIGLNAANARAAGADGLADSLDALQSDMVANQDGAFMPWHQQPFVRAILLPFGGTGVLQALEYILSRR